MWEPKLCLLRVGELKRSQKEALSLKFVPHHSENTDVPRSLKLTGKTRGLKGILLHPYRIPPKTGLLIPSVPARNAVPDVL
jgi:hypothetical protein